MKKFYTKSSHGFTLIELLVVIAVLGILAAGVFTAINPLERLAQTRDALRKAAVGQLVQAMQSYYTSHSGSYPPLDNNWITSLQNSGELRSVPTNPSYQSSISPCTTYAENNYCWDYNSSADAVAIFVRLESFSANNKCSGTTPRAYYVWSSVDGKVGLVCKSTTSEPSWGTNQFVAE